MGARERWSLDDGFTLMELAVVAIIIGILATIAIAVFLAQREKAERSAAISSARNTSTLAEAIRLTDDDSTYTDAPSAYEEEGGTGFDFVNTESTDPRVVSIKTFDADQVVIIASRGGGRCYWARQAVNGAPARGYFEVDEDDTCTADDLDLVDEGGGGW